MGDVFMVASGKGGVGKTTLCAMLGSQFARMDKTVVMLDTDFGLRNLDLYFHLENNFLIFPYLFHHQGQVCHLHILLHLE